MAKKKLSEWDSPLGHPSAVSRSKLLPEWIAWAFDDSSQNPNRFDPQTEKGVVFLYNISFETFRGNRFRTTWLNNYARVPGTGTPSCVDRIYLLVPYHPESQIKIGDTVAQRRLASWLNGELLLELIQSISNMNRFDVIDSTKVVLRKTWVSMVPIPSEKNRELNTTSVYGNYSFAFYLGVPREYDYGALDRYLTKIDYVCGEALHGEQDALTEETKFADFTRLLLAAGLEEPFSTWNQGFFQYELLLSFAPRANWPSFDPRNCALRTHVRLLSRLWSDRESPLSLQPCKPLQNLPTARHNKSIRMDAFLAWMGTIARSGKRDKRLEWRLPVSTDPLEIEAGPRHRQVRALLSIFPEWEGVFAVDDEVYQLLSEISELRLNQYSLIGSAAYYLREDALESLRSKFIDPLKSCINALLQPGDLQCYKFCAFLVCGASGSGKTEMFRAVADNIAPNNWDLVDVSYATEEKITRIIREKRGKASSCGQPFILGLDEFHNVKELGDICDFLYSEFDKIKSKRDPLVCVLLTSYGEGNPTRFRDLVLQARKRNGAKAPPDFWSRLEAHLVRIPVAGREDELLRIASEAKKALPDEKEIQIEKLALAYLLVVRPWDSGRGIKALAGPFEQNRNSTIKLEHLRPARPEFEREWIEFKNWKYASNFESKESLRIIF